MNETLEYRNTSSLRWLLLLGLLGLALLASLQIPATVDLALEMRMVSHPVTKHGVEATSIRKCLENNGPDRIWKFTSHRRSGFFIFTCLLDDGRWGLQIAQLTRAGEWLEKTAFIVKEGSAFELKEYVTARAVEFIGNVATFTL